MVSYSTIVFAVQVILPFVPNIKTLESNVTGAQSNTTTQCNICWSLVSAGQCQNTSKSEPCSPEQLDSTMSKIRLMHAPTPEQSLSGTPIKDHPPVQQYRCFTLSASSGAGESRKVFYAKGCSSSTVAAGDLCASWAKEKNTANCTLCTGNNCNAAAPMEISHGTPIKLNSKNSTSANSNRAVLVNSSFSWMVGLTLLSSLGTATFVF